MRTALRTLTIMVGVFFGIIWTINLVLLYRLVKNYGPGLGIAFWKQWRW